MKPNKAPKSHLVGLFEKSQFTTDLTKAGTVFVVDVSNVAHQSLFAQAYVEMKTTNGVLSGHIFGAFKKITTFLDRFGNERPVALVWAFDRPPTYKKKIYPAYKANRGEKFSDPAIDVGRMLEKFPSVSAWLEEHEADDIVASVVERLQNRRVFVFSTDKDIWQLMRPGLTIVGFKSEPTTPVMVVEKFGLKNPLKIPLHKSLWGDAGDNVPRVTRLPNVGEDKRILLELIEKSPNNAENLLALASSSALSEKTKQKLIDHREQILRNHSLVNLYRDLPFQTKINTADAAGLVKILEEFECKTLVQKASTMF